MFLPFQVELFVSSLTYFLYENAQKTQKTEMGGWLVTLWIQVYPAREQNARWTLSAASAFATISLAFGWIMNALEPFIWSRSGDTVHVYNLSSCLAIHPFFLLPFLDCFLICAFVWITLLGPFVFWNATDASKEKGKSAWFLPLPNGTFQSTFNK